MNDQEIAGVHRHRAAEEDVGDGLWIQNEP
jgi:hypothetical protein